MTLDELLQAAKLLGVEKVVANAMKAKLAEMNKPAPAGTNVANLRPAMQAAQLRADARPKVGRFPPKRPTPTYLRRGPQPPQPPTLPVPTLPPTPAPTIPTPQIPTGPRPQPPRTPTAPVTPVIKPPVQTGK